MWSANSPVGDRLPGTEGEPAGGRRARSLAPASQGARRHLLWELPEADHCSSACPGPLGHLHPRQQPEPLAPELCLVTPPCGPTTASLSPSQRAVGPQGPPILPQAVYVDSRHTGANKFHPPPRGKTHCPSVCLLSPPSSSRHTPVLPQCLLRTACEPYSLVTKTSVFISHLQQVRFYLFSKHSCNRCSKASAV